MSEEDRVLTVAEIAEVFDAVDVTDRWGGLENAWKLRAPIDWAALDAAP